MKRADWSVRDGVVVLLLGLVCQSVTVSATETNFSRYGIILDRQPFGTEPVVTAPPAPTVPPDQSVVNQIRMSAVVRGEDGSLRVGLIDLKSNRNYILGVGESMDNIEVISADYVKERARLRRGIEDYWVSMAGGSNRFERIVPSAPGETAAPPPGVTATNAAPAKPDVDQRLSYAKRRQQREAARLRVELERLRAVEAERAKLAAAQTGGLPASGAVGSGIRAGKGNVIDTNVSRALTAAFGETNKLDLTDDEIAQMLQEYQKELIRSGKTPLPIPLTPESDQELVNEGVLPPQE